MHKYYNETSKRYDNVTKTWLNSARCKDLYTKFTADPNDPIYDETIANEFDEGDWVCPDTNSFTIHNDPWLYEAGPGSALIMLINTCDVAQ